MEGARGERVPGLGGSREWHTSPAPPFSPGHGSDGSSRSPVPTTTPASPGLWTSPYFYLQPLCYSSEALGRVFMAGCPQQPTQ